MTDEKKPVEPKPDPKEEKAELDRLRLKDKLTEALRHLKNVHAACELLSLRFIERDEPGDREMAMILVYNGFMHDLSKLRGIEWQWIHQDQNKEMLLTAIGQHQSSNDHHPEFWGGADKMPPVKVAEMVCDWYARSQEKGTDLNEWVKSALKRFGIGPTTKLARQIKQYAALLLDKPFKKLK